MKKNIYTIIFIALSINIFAQQLPQFSLRMFDNIVINPAVTGTKSYNELTLHHRSQWIGFEGAPITDALSFNGKYFNNMGLGAYIVNDITGPTHRFGINLAYDYQVKVNDEYTLSLGVSGIIMQYGIDGNKITLYQKNDNLIQENTSDMVWKPDFNFGAYIYSDKLYVGISALQLFQTKMNVFDELNASIPLSRTYYIVSGYKIALNDDYFVEPSILFNTTFSSPIQIGVNALFAYKDKLFAGLSYRYNDALIFMLGAKIKDKLRIYYSYDLISSSFRQYNKKGSHEIIITFDIPRKKEIDSSLM